MIRSEGDAKERKRRVGETRMSIMNLWKRCADTSTQKADYVATIADHVATQHRPCCNNRRPCSYNRRPCCNATQTMLRQSQTMLQRNAAQRVATRRGVTGGICESAAHLLWYSHRVLWVLTRVHSVLWVLTGYSGNSHGYSRTLWFLRVLLGGHSTGTRAGPEAELPDSRHRRAARP